MNCSTSLGHSNWLECPWAIANRALGLAHPLQILRSRAGAFHSVLLPAARDSGGRDAGGAARAKATRMTASPDPEAGVENGAGTGNRVRDGRRNRVRFGRVGRGVNDKNTRRFLSFRQLQLPCTFFQGQAAVFL